MCKRESLIASLARDQSEFFTRRVRTPQETRFGQVLVMNRCQRIVEFLAMEWSMLEKCVRTCVRLLRVMMCEAETVPRRLRGI